MPSGAKIFLKREDLNHLSTHKINNTIGQALLAKYMSETHYRGNRRGSARCGICHDCRSPRQSAWCIWVRKMYSVRVPNVYRMKLGATVVPVTSGSKTLKDALNEAMRDWVTNVDDTFYIIGTVCYLSLIRQWYAISSGDWAWSASAEFWSKAANCQMLWWLV